MGEDEYEILPQKLLSDLKFDVEALKKKLVEPDIKINELILEIESMKDSIHELNAVFEKALEETKEEDLTETIKSLNEKLENVISQNETIAKGMVAISDQLDDFMQRQQGAKPVTMVQHTMGPPPMPQGISRVAPRMDADVPPPPTASKKRAGLFR